MGEEKKKKKNREKGADPDTMAVCMTIALINSGIFDA